MFDHCSQSSLCGRTRLGIFMGLYFGAQPNKTVVALHSAAAKLCAAAIRIIQPPRPHHAQHACMRKSHYASDQKCHAAQACSSIDQCVFCERDYAAQLQCQLLATVADARPASSSPVLVTGAVIVCLLSLLDDLPTYKAPGVISMLKQITNEHGSDQIPQYLMSG